MVRATENPTSLPPASWNFKHYVYLNVNESDPRSDVHYLGSSENKA